MSTRRKFSSAPRNGAAAAPSIYNQGHRAHNSESARPRSGERDQSENPLQSSIPGTPDPARVERLAYALWEERGRPHGSADDDWFRAEQLIRQDSVR